MFDLLRKNLFYMENTQINPGLPTKLVHQIKLHKAKSYTLKASTADASAKHNFTWNCLLLLTLRYQTINSGSSATMFYMFLLPVNFQ